LNPSLLVQEVERLKAAGRALYDLALKTGLDVEFPVLMGDAKKEFEIPDEPLQAVDPGRRISLPGDDPLYDAVRRYKTLTLEAAHAEGFSARRPGWGWCSRWARPGSCASRTGRR
jgi:hypothetical protein